MRKLILKNFMSPGDIVLLTAAVRDLHRCYPGQFATDVRTHCPDLWENNPHLTPLAENEPGVEIVDCDLPLIDLCNEQPYHVIHGFIDFLNAHLNLRIRPTAFCGDIHLSAQERAWYSQIRELTGNDIPYWIVAAGGKYDVTIKWWATERYQQVVDHFLGKIQFVQVGDWGHYHPPLKGVIDLRGQTNLRELVRLVYHAEGVLCSITALMHLAAAVETKSPGRSRACVVIAGGREPAHWEAYPDHQFIHTTGALPCCTGGGCWRERVLPLGDGDQRDQPDHLCVDVVGRLPRCLHVITPEDVIRRIQLYEQGGSLRYLARTEWAAAKRGIKATRHNGFDDQPLTLPTARLALEAFLPTLTPCPDGFAGRGIVICGGGPRYFTNAWVCIHRLRGLGCALPIEVWHLGDEEIDAEMRSLLEPLGVRCVDGLKVRAAHPVRRLAGYELKPFALLYSSFAEVLFLDADNVPVADPEGLFATPEYQKCGAIFWPDFEQLPEGEVIWRSCNLARPPGPEFESGQMVIDKRRCWEPLRLAMWFNEHSDFFYKHLLGDKETFHLAFCKLNRPFHLVATPIHALEGTMCQHDLQGRRLIQHRNMDKWNLFLRNKLIDDFWHEEECIGHVKDLRRKWDGRASRYRPALPPARRVRPSLAITVCLISCAQRRALREQTLNDLADTDWGDEPVLLQMDPGGDQPPDQRQVANSRLALQAGLARPGDYLLFLEDDLEFNLHLRHNLEHWLPLQAGAVTLAGLYNPDVQEIACDFEHNYVVLAPERIFGSQAFLLSRAAAQYVLDHWDEGERLQDIRISRLAARLGNPIFYHAPSLVQHVGRTSSWGGFFHEAADFDKYWRAPANGVPGSTPKVQNRET